MQRLSRLLRGFASDVAVTTGARCGSQAISLIAMIFAGRFLSLGQFGAFAIGWIAVVVATTFIYTGFYEYLLLAPDQKQVRDSVFWLMALLGSFCMVVIACVGLACGGPADMTGSILLWFSPLPLIAVPAAWSEALLLRAGRLRRVALGTLVPEFTGLVALIAGLVGGMGWHALILWRIFTALTSLVTLLALARLRPRLGWCAETRRSATKVALPLYGSALTQMAGNYGADILLAVMLSPPAVGAYRAGSRFVSAICDMLYRPVRTLCWTRMAAVTRNGDSHALGEIWQENSGFLVAVAWPALAIVAVVGPDLIVTFINPAWGAAGPVLRLLAIAGMAQALDLLLEPALSCLGERRLLSSIRLGSVALLVAALAVAAPYGATAAAGVVVVVRLVVAAAAVWALAHKLYVPAQRLLSMVLLGATVALLCTSAALAPMLLGSNAPMRMVVVGGLASGVWIALLVPLVLTRRIVLPAK